MYTPTRWTPSTSSGPPNLPFQVLDAHLFPQLLVIIIPFTLLQVNASKHGVGCKALGLPFTLVESSQHGLWPRRRGIQPNVGLELRKLQSTAVDLYDILGLRWGCLLIGSRRRLYRRRRLPL